MLDDELRDAFAAESAEHLDAAERLLLAAPGGVAADRTAVDALFRAVHSLKGMSAALGAEGLRGVAHRCEDLLGAARTGRVAVVGAVVDALLAALDAMRAQRAAALEGRADPPVPAEVSARLSLLVDGEGGSAPELPASAAPPVASQFVEFAAVLRREVHDLATLAAGPDEAPAALASDLAARAGALGLGRLAGTLHQLVGAAGPDAMAPLGRLRRHAAFLTEVTSADAGAAGLASAVAALTEGMPPPELSALATAVEDLATGCAGGSAPDGTAVAAAARRAGEVAAALGCDAIEASLLSLEDWADRLREPGAAAMFVAEAPQIAARFRRYAGEHASATREPRAAEDFRDAPAEPGPGSGTVSTGSALVPADRGDPRALPSATMRVRQDTVDAVIALEAEVRAAAIAVSEALGDDARRALPSALAAVARRLPIGVGPTRELDEIADRLARLQEQLGKAGARLSLGLRRLEEAVLELRVVPASVLFARLPRAVRDAAGTAGKEVDLSLEGEEVSLDRDLAELLADPMLHLVRNAVGHGLEPPAERRAAGKPARGALRVAVRRRAGGVRIEVSDDGRGVEREAVLRAAIARGLTTEVEAAAMDDLAVHALLFHAGFSTRERADHLSGRGVGLDVVGEAVRKAGGTVAVRSEPGRGTRFSMDLPLSAGLVPVLLVEEGGHPYAVPAARVRMVLRAGAPDAGPDLALVSLRELLGLPGSAPAGTVVVLRRADGQECGLLVERAVRRTELLLRPLHPALAALPAIGGVGVLGGGEAVVLLDPDGLGEGGPAKRSALAK